MLLRCWCTATDEEGKWGGGKHVVVVVKDSPGLSLVRALSLDSSFFPPPHSPPIVRIVTSRLCRVYGDDHLVLKFDEMMVLRIWVSVLVCCCRDDDLTV